MICISDIIYPDMTVTTSIYYKQFVELQERISKISDTDNYMILVKKNLYEECKQICDKYRIMCKATSYIPDDVLFCIINKDFLK